MKTLNTTLESFGKVYADKDVLANLPPATGEEVELFTIGKYVTRKELEEEYESRGLVPASPYDLLALHERDKNLAEEKRWTATIFDYNGPCYTAFYRWHDERRVYVRRYDRDWNDDWWFGAVKAKPFNYPQPIDFPEGVENRLKEYEINTNGCWEWKGTVSKGYGVMKVMGRSIRVHRLMYEVFVGSIPEGLVLDHVCLNKQCVNPEHLEPVSLRANTLRGSSPIAENARKTHCSKGHKFSKENTVIKDGGRRRCKKCLTKKV